MFRRKLASLSPLAGVVSSSAMSTGSRLLDDLEMMVAESRMEGLAVTSTGEEDEEKKKEEQLWEAVRGSYQKSISEMRRLAAHHGKLIKLLSPSTTK